jgi:hypothetical protein
MAPAISSAVKYTLVAALAAAGMYLLDPARGRRRRALARNKIVSRLKGARQSTGVMGRDARHGLHASVDRAHSLIRSNDVSDEILVARVRAGVGRVTPNAGAIYVTCSHGVVTLQGAVLKHEHPRVMREARSAAGVDEVHDELAAYKRPTDVPDLQGGAWPGA